MLIAFFVPTKYVSIVTYINSTGTGHAARVEQYDQGLQCSLAYSTDSVAFGKSLLKLVVLYLPTRCDW